MKIKYLAFAAAILASSLTASAWDLKSILTKAGEAASGVQQQQQNTEQQPATSSENQSGFSLGSLLGGLGNSSSENSNLSNALGGIVNGIFTKNNLTVADIVGTWKVDGSAVSFRSDNFLQQAGGSAAASIIEGKLNPYYNKYGLTGAVLTINEDATFTLKMKKATLSGTISVQEADNNTEHGNFFFNFNTLGFGSMGSVNTYVTKSLNGLEIMFDASKLQSLITAIADISKIQVAQTASQLLNQYEGICIGFDLTRSK